MWKGILVLVIGFIGIMAVLIDANCNEKTTERDVARTWLAVIMGGTFAIGLTAVFL